MRAISSSVRKWTRAFSSGAMGWAVQCGLVRPVGAVLLFGGALIGCSDGPRREASGEMTPIVDVNPAADLVEVNLVASPSRQSYLPDGPADIWAYRDGSVAGSRAAVPGPLIEAKQGDSVIVHFTNELPESTTIHWHGVRVPNGADGTLATQTEIPPGGTFDYRFVAVDAGTFWYHPHVRGDVQVERGLYGMLVVRGGPEVPVSADRAFVLDDVKLEATGKLSETTDPLDVMLGRQGNVLLVNGASVPTYDVKVGARERWRFVNAANGRYFNLRLVGHTFRVIGWDGGVLREPYETDTLLVAPGERYEVLVELAGADGTVAALQTLHYDRGHDVPDPGPQDVLKLRFMGTAASAPPLPAAWGEFAPLSVAADTPAQTVVLDEDEGAPGQDPKFSINGRSFPDVVPFEGVAGDVSIWSIQNHSPMDHPFHLHGMFFQVLDINGVPPAHIGWKDTVNVPQKATLRFAVRYGAAGEWMFHCHILEHAERGMMSSIRLSKMP
jgi:FtsP/CotA-like multicopper oxidase with cupredoxin domain